MAVPHRGCTETKARVCVACAKQMERHVAPTIKEIIGDLNGAKLFSTLDLSQGYSQLELPPESR